MTYLRICDTAVFDVSLTEEGVQDLPRFAGGQCLQHETKKAPKSSIIKGLNEPLGTEFTEANRMHFEQSVAAAFESPVIHERALESDEVNFAYRFNPQFEEVLLDRHEMSATLVQRHLSDLDFPRYVTGWARTEAFQRIREST